MYTLASRRPATQSGRGKTYFVIPIRNRGVGLRCKDTDFIFRGSLTQSINDKSSWFVGKWNKKQSFVENETRSSGHKLCYSMLELFRAAEVWKCKSNR